VLRFLAVILLILTGHALEDDAEWWRAVGSLAAPLGPAELVTLNMGLRYLFEELGTAHDVYASGQHLDGAYGSLCAIVAFLSMFRPVGVEGLFVPLAALESALWALDEGVVEPILKPPRPPKSGRARSSVLHQELKGVAVYVAHRLCDLGLSQPEAFKAVSDDLKRIGVKPDRGSGEIEPRTVRGWCEEVAEDVGHHGTAALRYHALRSHPANMTLDKIPQEAARVMLRSQLRSFAIISGNRSKTT
jgi:hypothetical protein